MKAIEDAPTTESGIIIPPHVASRRDEVEAPKPNRRERRWQEKQARRAAKQQARRKPVDPQTRELVDQAKEAMDGMNDEQRQVAMGMLREVADAPPALRKEIIREQQERHR